MRDEMTYYLEKLGTAEESKRNWEQRAIAAEAEVARLRAALERYGQHETDEDSDCPKFCGYPDPCNCGLDAALSGTCDAPAGKVSP